MSADHWGICPACKRKAIAEHDRMVQEAVEFFGKEREQLRAAADKKIRFEAETTLREDYECWIDEDGLFTINYTAHCQKCGFRKAFEHEEQL